MAMIGFVMIAFLDLRLLSAATGGVTVLVDTFSQGYINNKGLAAFLMLLSWIIHYYGNWFFFLTVPIITSIYIPLCLSLDSLLWRLFLLWALQQALVMQVHLLQILLVTNIRIKYGR